jgi:hypothetical protein
MGTDAVDSMKQMSEVRGVSEVDEAIRNAAANAPSAGVRAAACESIALRDDRKGAPSVLEAFRKADVPTIERVRGALRNLAHGRPVPLDTPERASDWWRQSFPQDF